MTVPTIVAIDLLNELPQKLHFRRKSSIEHDNKKRVATSNIVPTLRIFVFDRARLKFTQDEIISNVRQLITSTVIDVLTQKPNRTITQRDLNTAGVIATWAFTT